MKIAIICGGPSLERGISLNSARSLLDHLSGDDIEIVPFYLDSEKKPFEISKAQLYSNNPSDFDFKLVRTAKALTEASFAKRLKSCDITFPVMHGEFGEDGGIQRFLERYKIPFVGTGSKEARRAFDKYSANEYLRSNGFFAMPSALLKIFQNDHRRIIKDFFREHKIKRAIVKPAKGGSSIGVFSVSEPEEAFEKARLIFSKRMDTRVVIEPFAEGVEFTSIILENRFGMPVCILPTEIQVDYAAHQFFDFRKKYLPTNRVVYHCPPRFSNDVIQHIQVQAEQIFKLFGMRDFARFDGWVLKNGEIWFSDLNPISGMEQNSFLFQQASRIGMAHSDVLRYIVRNASKRQGIRPPKIPDFSAVKKQRVNIIFGGNTSERQVSLMSGTNAWLKLRNSRDYDPKPYLLDNSGQVWELPYAYALNHTVEEIAENCRNAREASVRLDYLVNKSLEHLTLLKGENSYETPIPKKLSLEDFLRASKGRIVLNALHGGMGEDGTMQKMLEARKIAFNGSPEAASALCMDKYKTSEKIKNSGLEGIEAVPGFIFNLSFFAAMADEEYRKVWKDVRRKLGSRSLLIKPNADGCSSGVAHLWSSADIKRYLDILSSGAAFIPKGTFRKQADIIELPMREPKEILLQKFIETDIIKIRGNTLKCVPRTGWLEITVGVIEENGRLKAFAPSITVAEGDVLTVEEKFQGGTGVNITPPPENIVSGRVTARARKLAETTGKLLGIRGYARIDAFMNRYNGDLMVIEANTLPALTPSTVIFQQALAENPAMYPIDFLESIIDNIKLKIDY